MRINELARELEVKAKTILDFLPTLGITDKRSHSSAIEDDLAEKVRRHFAPEGAAPAAELGGGVAVLEGEAPVPTDLGVRERSESLAGVLRPEIGHEPPVPLAPMPAAPTPAEENGGASSSPASGWSPAVPPAGRAEPRPPLMPRHEAPEHAGRSVLRPPVRPHVTPPAAPKLAPPPPTLGPPASAGGVIAAVEEQVAVSAQPGLTEVGAPSTPTLAGPPPVLPVIRPPAEPPSPPLPRIGVQGPMGAPRPGVPGPVSRAGAVPATPRVMAPAPNVTPPLRPVAPRGLAPGQPIYQPRPGAPARSGQLRPGGAMAGTAAGGAVGRPSRPTRPIPSAPGAPGQPGRFERRPLHPTRARPGVAAPGAPAPPGLERQRAAPRPSVPVRDRERPLRSGPPRLAPLAFTPREIDREITIIEGITVKDLAEKLEIKAKDLMQRLISRGIFATINQTLDSQVAADLSRDFGAEARVISFEQETIEAATPETVEEAGELAPRPPVVTIMGHVDHGKTSLLDVIRQTHVTEQEAGGITQHIGAYQVEINNRKITFIDTPGHEAFTRMRARGSKVTDIVVLVVAADDGVMPQTLEAIDHARAANVPIVVAINKIDKPEAQPERVKRQLADRGLMPEDWGGQTVTVEVSAKQQKNLDLLLEMILLVADLQELKANPTRPAMATVLEAELDRGRGPVATVLVQNGTLRVGDPFIVGPVFGKVRALLDDRGRHLQEAPPATPVEVLGLGSLPQSGDQFQVVTDLLKAKQMALYRGQKAREAALARSARLTLDQLHEQMKAGVVKELNLILKSDVHGSAEVLAETLSKLATDKVKVKIIHTGVGAITESDVLLASASNAVIIGFNARPERNAQETAEQEKVDIRLHTVIYNVVDEIKKAMTGLLEPTIREIHLGRAEVRQTFRIPKVGAVAGCYVQDGKLTQHAEVRLLRDNVVVYVGKVASLRRFKDDASEVKSGFECGVGLENFSDIKQGDIIEAFVTEKVAAEMLA